MSSLNFHMFVVTLTETYHVADHKPTSSSMNSQTDFLPSIWSRLLRQQDSLLVELDVLLFQLKH